MILTVDTINYVRAPRPIHISRSVLKINLRIERLIREREFCSKMLRSKVR